MSLGQGEALVFAKRHSVTEEASRQTADKTSHSHSSNVAVRTYRDTNITHETAADDEEREDQLLDDETARTTDTTESNQHHFDDFSAFGRNMFPLSIRPRVTRDLGASKTHHV